jgi:hypothetical protein
VIGRSAEINMTDSSIRRVRRDRKFITGMNNQDLVLLEHRKPGSQTPAHPGFLKKSRFGGEKSRNIPDFSPARNSLSTYPPTGETSF